MRSLLLNLLIYYLFCYIVDAMGMRSLGSMKDGVVLWLAPLLLSAVLATTEGNAPCLSNDYRPQTKFGAR